MFDWRKVETAFFDMDGTLLDLHFDSFFWLEHLPKRFTEIKKTSSEETNKKLLTMFETYQGSLNWYCLDFWSNELDIDIASLKEEVSAKISYRPHVQKLLTQLQSLDIDLAIVTNAHQDSINLKFRHTDLANYFDEVICSHDYGVEKESVQFWTALHEKRAFNPEKTVFFDDNEDVLSAAKSFGIKQLFSIAKPDSQKQSNAEKEFKMVQCFSDFYPSISE